LPILLGFPCGCPACASPAPGSDERVLRLKHLTDQLPVTDFDTPLDPDESSDELDAELVVIQEMINLARTESLWDLEKSLLRRQEVVRKVQRGPRGMVVGDGKWEMENGMVCPCCV
jgi:hypothetical protein